MFSGTIKGVALGPLVQDSSSLAAHRLSRRLYNIHITFPLQRPRFFFFRTTKRFDNSLCDDASAGGVSSSSPTPPIEMEAQSSSPPRRWEK